MKVLKFLNIALLSLMFILTVLVITTPWIGFLIYFAYAIEACVALYSLRHIDEQRLKQIQTVLFYYIGISVSLLIIIGIYQSANTYTFIPYIKYSPVFVFFIWYPIAALIEIILLKHIILESNRNIITTIFSIIMFFAIFLNGLFAITPPSISILSFDDNENTIYISEREGSATSSHTLYVKKNAFFVEKIEPVQGSFHCQYGCPTNSPESYEWTWLDDYTLVVSYDEFNDDVTYLLTRE